MHSHAGFCAYWFRLVKSIGGYLNVTRLTASIQNRNRLSYLAWCRQNQQRLNSVQKDRQKDIYVSAKTDILGRNIICFLVILKLV